jgi:hypothetical protein
LQKRLDEKDGEIIFLRSEVVLLAKNKQHCRLALILEFRRVDEPRPAGGRRSRRDRNILPLAVSSRQPMLVPIAVPTARSSGIDYEYSTWYGILAPARTPAAILQSLNTAIAEIGMDSHLKDKIVAQGIEPRAIARRDFDLQIRRDMDRLAPLLKSLPERLDN